jgi:hypothetical protein
MNSAGLGTEIDCSGKDQTRLLVKEGAPHQDNRNCQTENKNVVMGSRWEPDTETDWPTNRRS